MHVCTCYQDVDTSAHAMHDTTKLDQLTNSLKYDLQDQPSTRRLLQQDLLCKSVSIQDMGDVLSPALSRSLTFRSVLLCTDEIFMTATLSWSDEFEVPH